MSDAKAYAAQNEKSPLAPFSIQRRDPRVQDIQVRILYCGVCHSDLHIVRNEWNETKYPIVPGHEIVGRVIKAGSGVKKFKEGDIAAIGPVCDSCRECGHCKSGLEQFCENNPTFTFGSPDKISGGHTQGGYSENIVVDEAFAVRVPKNLDLAGAAPLLCAGITTYSPLRFHKVSKGQKVGVVGLGGLGHMGVKFAKHFGARVVVFTTSPAKTGDALRLGADEVVISKNENEMEKHANSFHFILDTVSAQHDVNAYLKLLRLDGVLTHVGLPPDPLAVDVGNLIFNRRKFTGSLIGGMQETQEMLDFCGEHGIQADIEMIPIQKINEAYERLLKGQVKYRFVIDMATLR
jgi:alcohol dehydrogenase (NADP+)